MVRVGESSSGGDGHEGLVVSQVITARGLSLASWTLGQAREAIRPDMKKPQRPRPRGDMLQLFHAVLLDESGQDLAEYAILIGLIALAVIAAVTLLGGTISTVFNSIGTTLADAMSSAAGDPPTCCD